MKTLNEDKITCFLCCAFTELNYESYSYILIFKSNCYAVIMQDGVDAIFQGDMSFNCLTKTLPSHLPTLSVAFDEESLPFKTNAFDIVLSSLR